MTRHREAMGWSLVCDCGISWSYLLTCVEDTFLSRCHGFGLQCEIMAVLVIPTYFWELTFSGQYIHVWLLSQEASVSELFLCNKENNAEYISC